VVCFRHVSVNTLHKGGGGGGGGAAAAITTFSSIMQGIYTYISEAYHVSREYSVAAIL
jgi:uncharacterized BrkB/YihY/UPF0761 family membrane protein